ncbi:hypothetical protein DIPPA_02786 [Diplonema papillatum]|nr:hypothetical protein DIPPA_02786 [Diplonema papillatum]
MSLAHYLDELFGPNADAVLDVCLKEGWGRDDLTSLPRGDLLAAGLLDEEVRRLMDERRPAAGRKRGRSDDRVRVGPSGLGGANKAFSSRVVRFATEHVEDTESRERIVTQLTDLGPKIAGEIMDRSVEDARNPMAVIFARIGAARSSQRVTEFAAEWSLDSECEDALRSLPPKDASRIMAGSMEGARDANAVLMSRINACLKSLGKEPVRKLQPVRAVERDVKRRKVSRSPSADTASSASSRQLEALSYDIDDFTDQNIAPDTAERVQQMLKDLSPRAARLVMERELETAKNPTAVVLRRLTDMAKKDKPSLGQQIALFCRKHSLNDDIEDQLRQLPKTDAKWVMARHPLSTETQHFVTKRIREARGNGEYIPRDDRADDLIKAYRLPPATERLIRLLDSRTLDRVMLKAQQARSDDEMADIVHDRCANFVIQREPGQKMIGIAFVASSLKVQSVVRGSPADRAGIPRNWRLIAVNDRPVASKQEAVNLAGTTGDFSVTMVRRF